eukprot:15465218-Alexandrium_andersonii.AAC.1
MSRGMVTSFPCELAGLALGFPGLIDFEQVGVGEAANLPGRPIGPSGQRAHPSFWVTDSNLRAELLLR